MPCSNVGRHSSASEPVCFCLLIPEKETWTAETISEGVSAHFFYAPIKVLSEGCPLYRIPMSNETPHFLAVPGGTLIRLRGDFVRMSSVEFPSETRCEDPPPLAHLPLFVSSLSLFPGEQFFSSSGERTSGYKTALSHPKIPIRGHYVRTTAGSEKPANPKAQQELESTQQATFIWTSQIVWGGGFLRARRLRNISIWEPYRSLQ